MSFVAKSVKTTVHEIKTKRITRKDMKTKYNRRSSSTKYVRADRKPILYLID